MHRGTAETAGSINAKVGYDDGHLCPVRCLSDVLWKVFEVGAGTGPYLSGVSCGVHPRLGIITWLLRSCV